jgi:hypothetical protein
MLHRYVGELQEGTDASSTRAQLPEAVVKQVRAARGVAVAGWQWHRWMGEGGAVRTV